MKAARRKGSGPFSEGFHGHARSCRCPRCCESRARQVKESWKEHGAAAEPSRQKTIFVRSYWREGNQRPENRRAILKVMFG